MTDAETPSGRSHERGRGCWRRKKMYVPLGLVVLSLVALLSWAVWMRPAARVDRLLAGLGLGRLPPSAEDLVVDKQGRLSGHRRTFVRFGASVEDVARFVEAAIADAGDPVPMRNIHFGPSVPPWMRWDTTVDGRMYHFRTVRASVWLAVDDGLHIVYLGVFTSPPPWLLNLFESAQGP